MVQKILQLGLFSSIVLWAIIWTFNLGFSATVCNSWWTNIAYYLTQSGGTVGTTIGVIVACVLYTVQEIGWKNKLVIFGKAFVGLALIIGTFAAINEKYTKPLLKLERPSHHEMLSRLQMNALVDSLYQLSKDERIAFFGGQTVNKPELFNNIDPQVLQHWVLEGGYSFPSGHTFNAFLLAMIFSFGILHNTKNVNLRKLYYLPFVWATGIGVSRVALGAHSIIDVTAGALMGVFIAGLLLYVDITRHLITHKKFLK
jgi:phosphatidylglycerophosphatase B